MAGSSGTHVRPWSVARGVRPQLAAAEVVAVSWLRRRRARPRRWRRESVTEVLVEHGPHAVVQAWELVSLLSQRQGWKVQGGTVQTGVEIGWRFGSARRRARAPSNVLSKDRRKFAMCAGLSYQQQAGGHDFVVESAERLAMALEGIDSEPRTIAMPPLPPAELVGRQPIDRERDPVFREYGRGPGDGSKRVIR